MNMPFGKHRGARVEDVPPSYLAWLYFEGRDLDPALKDRIAGVLLGKLPAQPLEPPERNAKPGDSCAAIPARAAALVAEGKLPSTAYFVLACLARLCRVGEHGCVTTYDELAGMTGFKWRTAYGALDKLRSNGLVRITRADPNDPAVVRVEFLWPRGADAPPEASRPTPPPVAGPAEIARHVNAAKMAVRDAVKTAYRQLAIKHHPDKGGAAGIMGGVNLMFERVEEALARPQ